MPRPTKNIVDYFPHDADASQGKTLTILFNNFGHQGISAWWQLLERISRADGHVIWLRNEEDLEYFAAGMHLQTDRLKAILDKMAELDAIDKELYRSGAIWSQNFVNRISAVYKARKAPAPERPTVSIGDNPVSLPNNSVSAPDNSVSVVSVPDNSVSMPDNEQSKVNKSKVNEIREDTLQGEVSPFGSAFKNCSKFEDYHNLLEVYPDRVAFLINVFKKLHSNAPAEDIQKCGGRLANMWSKKGKDAGFILKVIWDSASHGIAGSHLDYIQKVLFKGDRKARDPDRFIKGKFGHMVVR